ncbi:MAG: extracellular solute-binding protein [Anaerolineales bacterium]|nr:extracellular solute-binding protein [Anaerolineales bacterium]
MTGQTAGSNRSRFFDWIILAAVVAVLVAYWLLSVSRKSHEPIRLMIYAFSTQEEVLNREVFPAFEAAWEAENEHDLIIEAVFGPSGTLARQIVLGAPADVAIFSNVQHVNWLKVGKKVSIGTEPLEVSYTPIVIVVRPGNPHNIGSFADLAQSGLRLVHADPRSSGVGEWALLAEYGSALFETGDQEEAVRQVKDIWQNVCVLTSSARATLTLFELGAGDAMLTYEQDARLAQLRNVPLEIVVPERTIIAHHVAVLVDDNLTSNERLAAEAFMHYIESDAGQEALTRCCLRSIVDGENASPPVLRPFTVSDLGGWPHIYSELIEGIWQAEIEPRLDVEAAGNLINPATE